MAAVPTASGIVLLQVAVAAMDCYRKDVVEDCLKEIKREFAPKSFRVRRLTAMQWEMLEEWDKALRIYDHVSRGSN